MSTSTVVSERERAKQIIAEIIRQAGGILTSKTALVGAFRRAHLAFAESQPGYLSFWPLVKTPAGPAIRDADVLLGELVAEGTLRIDEAKAGEATGLRLELTGQGIAAGALPDEAVEAIQLAVAAAPADSSAYTSLRSWNEAAEGEELNIYLDVIPEAEYAERKQRLDEMAPALKSLWG